MWWLLVLLASLLLSQGAVGLPIVAVDLDPSTSAIESVRTVAAGSTFTVLVVYETEGDLSLVNGFEFDLAYDAALTAVAIRAGDFLLAPVLELEASVGPPEVRAAFVTLGSGGMGGSGVLASIDFVAPSAGDRNLVLNQVVVAAPFGVDIPIEEPLEATVSVPEPGTPLLLGIGIAALVARREARA